jgi:peptidoglycan/LPS O-acetylase OafA/YrhL/lysophospholipase L1-like esterase
VPEPIGRDQRYMPGLDGLRALAVLAVVAFHLGVSWAPGGLLGVGVFFTLSGYLITDLLLGEWRSKGAIQLKDFWLRRARRLLPALFVMLIVVAIWVAIADPSQLGALRGDTLAAALYGSNWWLIFHHISYFARFGPPSPLGHLWSLAVEEQFYLIWPFLLFLGLMWVRRDPAAHIDRRRSHRVHILALFTLLGAALSALEMGLLYHPALDPTRVYDATDTRAFGLLFGAALAMVWPSRGLRAGVTVGARRLIDCLGILGLLGIALLVWQTNQYSPFLYQGGMVLLSLSTVAVLVAATHPASRIGPILGWRPLRSIGIISYGIYLWHYPVIVLTTPNVVGTTGASPHVDFPRAVVQVVVIIAIAALSWRYIETPIRHGALARLWSELRSRNWRLGGLERRVSTSVVAAATAIAIAVVGLAGVLPVAPAGTLAAVKPLDFEAQTSGASASIDRVVRTSSPPSARTTDPPDGWFTLWDRTTTTTTAPPPRTTCQSVVHIGDSTSESLVSNDYLNPPQQLPAQYEQVGVQNVDLQISGARSIVETYEGQPNGYQVAQQLLGQGYNGCWVIALGTNDAADVAVGSNVGMAERVQRMMTLIGNQPVMWVNAISLLNSGPYSESYMQQWNQALVQACPAYPNMRVFNWAAIAQPSYFISDGIHYTSAGSAVRANAIAQALAKAFPASPPTPTTTTTLLHGSSRSSTDPKTGSDPSSISAHHRGELQPATTTTSPPRNTDCVVP